MTGVDEYGSVLIEIQAEWNKAEADIKSAEQVSRTIVIPAIKELRYAGRRIVDILQAIQSGKPSATIAALFEEAKFDCHRARHDAIAAVAEMISATETMVEQLGYEATLRAYPEFPKFTRALNQVKQRIATSRQNREQREAIYSSIESVDFIGLVRQFDDIKSCEPIMVRLAQRERLKSSLSWIGILFGVLGAAASIYALYVC